MGSPRPYCLSIAGFDPSGGAGIVADCKTFEQTATHGLSVQTANTLQTEDQYIGTHWTPVAIILAQLRLLLGRYPVRHFKIGLIENGEVLLAVLETIHAAVDKPFILWDPVIQPSAGGQLSETRFGSQLPQILSQLSMITPNLPEYALLFGEADPQVMTQQHQLMIYLKGGHAADKGKDVLYTPEKRYPFNPRTATALDKHGTGCILSAALTGHLARRFPLVKACLKSKRYLEKALTSNPTLLAYHRS